ncbi:MAG TPA: hypothetical protein VK868_15685 [Pyrinomonadaceae bacterium]|nr:hypothetical protein [Pyrinomonadaceae bacterium]
MENPKITITIVHGGSDKHELKFCYFQEIDDTDTFLFFQHDGTPIPTFPSPVLNGEDFSFQLGEDDGKKIHWVIFEFKISEETRRAHGRWWAHTRDEFGAGDPETGTFQAPGGNQEELSAGASASA